MQQRMQKPMQMELRQTRRHLGNDRRRPDKKATAPIHWLSHDSNVILLMYILMFTQFNFCVIDLTN